MDRPYFTGLDFSWKNKGLIYSTKKHVCDCTAKTGTGFVFPNSYPQVTLELESLWKLYTLQKNKNLIDRGGKEKG